MSRAAIYAKALEIERERDELRAALRQAEAERDKAKQDASRWAKSTHEWTERALKSEAEAAAIRALLMDLRPSFVEDEPCGDPECDACRPMKDIDRALSTSAGKAALDVLRAAEAARMYALTHHEDCAALRNPVAECDCGADDAHDAFQAAMHAWKGEPKP